jgi:N-acetylmuramoyl-L-alanine amidase
MRLPIALVLLVLALAAALAACRASREPLPIELGPAPTGDSIVIAGDRISVGTPVVLWSDIGGYDAYRTTAHFGRVTGREGAPEDGALRYRPGRTDKEGRERVKPRSQELLAVQGAVDMFVVHYDVCGTSRQCFRVLHDLRGLSVHFMIDVDGTIYQTMDLADTAWHASQVNWRSVGVELANIGSYALSDEEGLATLDDWYPKDEDGPYIEFPRSIGDPGVRTREFVARPARPERIVGPMQGKLRAQYDYTPQQYDALVRLTAVLCKTLPRIQPDVPRDDAGRVLTSRMTEEHEARFRGIVGHHHVSEQKQDPGPAFDWEVFLARLDARLQKQ